MPETVTLNTPIARPSITTLALVRVIIDVEGKSLYVEWRHSDGTLGSAAYPTPAPQGSSQPSGQTLLGTINKRNFSAGNASFVNQLYQRLAADGYFAGSISGTHD